MNWDYSKKKEECRSSCNLLQKPLSLLWDFDLLFYLYSIYFYYVRARTKFLLSRLLLNIPLQEVRRVYDLNKCQTLYHFCFLCLQGEIRGFSTVTSTPGRRRIFPNTSPLSTTSAVSPSTPTCQPLNSEFTHSSFSDFSFHKTPVSSKK